MSGHRNKCDRALIIYASLPTQQDSALPESVSQFQVVENSTECEERSDEESLEMPVSVIHHNSKLDVDLSEVSQALAIFQDASPSDDVIQGQVPQQTGTSEHANHDVELDIRLNGETINEMPAVDRHSQAARSRQKASPSPSPSPSRRTTPARGVRQTPSTVVPNNPTNQSHKHTEQDYAYLQNLFERAITIQAEAEAKAKLARQAAQEAEWQQRLEENIRLKAEADIHEKMERARVEMEQRRLAEQQQEEAEKVLKKQALEEAKAKIEEMHRMRLGKDKPPLRFKDAVGRKFNFPFHLCQTWQVREHVVVHS